MRESSHSFSYNQVMNSSPPRNSLHGFCVFFTGLSGAGKTTLANALDVTLRKTTSRPTTLLDGDVIRAHLSSELGFSREHRNLNVQRMGFVASEVVKHGGITIVAAIAPFDDARKSARNIVFEQGHFYLVHVSTPLSVCEARDVKGLYARARAGLLKEFTGVSDPYEVPHDAEINIDTSIVSQADAILQIVERLRGDGHLREATNEKY
jgi:sulfate adenylyltransferase